MKVAISRGLFALVDDEDYPSVSTHTWRAIPTGRTKDVFYAATHIGTSRKDRKSVLMHRYVLNAKKNEIIDHKNHDTLDNRKENLRLGTSFLNQLNKSSHRNKKYSKYKGVCYDKRSNSWYTHFRGKHIGSFKDELSAARAYNQAAEACNSEWALINKI